MHIKSLVLASVLLVLSLVACAGAPAATPTPSGPQVVVATLTTYGFKFTPDKIKAGEVKFIVKNNATDVLHELWIVKTDLALDKLPLISDGTKIDETAKTFTKL